MICIYVATKTDKTQQKLKKLQDITINCKKFLDHLLYTRNMSAMMIRCELSQLKILELRIKTNFPFVKYRMENPKLLMNY